MGRILTITALGVVAWLAWRHFRGQSMDSGDAVRPVKDPGRTSGVVAPDEDHTPKWENQVIAGYFRRVSPELDDPRDEPGDERGVGGVGGGSTGFDLGGRVDVDFGSGGWL